MAQLATRPWAISFPTGSLSLLNQYKDGGICIIAEHMAHARDRHPNHHCRLIMNAQHNPSMSSSQSLGACCLWPGSKPDTQDVHPRGTRYTHTHIYRTASGREAGFRELSCEQWQEQLFEGGGMGWKPQQKEIQAFFWVNLSQKYCCC